MDSFIPTATSLKQQKQNQDYANQYHDLPHEPILEDPERMALYPIQDMEVWTFYQNHISTFWTAREIDLSSDVTEWDEKLTDNERSYVEMVLAFFSMSDFIVNENLSIRTPAITHLELQMFYRFQQMMEDIHSTVYADFIQTLVQDPLRREHLFHAVKTTPSITKKAKWARDAICDENKQTVSLNDRSIHINQFVRQLVVFAVVEGIFFSGSFCAIFWLRKRGLMPGLTFANELIARDEGLHRDLACHVYKRLIVNKLDEQEVINIVQQGVNLEKEFVCESLPVELIGMNSTMMCQYIEYVADHLFLNLIGKQVYNTPNPFPWVLVSSLESKSNFFETRVAGYAKADLHDTEKKGNNNDGIHISDEF